MPQAPRASTAMQSGGFRAVQSGGVRAFQSGGVNGKYATVQPRAVVAGAGGNAGRSQAATAALRISGVLFLAIVVGVGGGALFTLATRSDGLPSLAALPSKAPALPDLAGPVPATLPTAPFAVEPPEPMTIEGLATSSVTDTYEADARSADALALGQLREAAAWSDRAVRLSGMPHQFAHHAALLAQVGQADAAMYWLVRAIDEVGLDPLRLVEDTRYAKLWADPRWEDLANWAVARHRFDNAHPTPRAVAWLPGAASREFALANDEGISQPPTFDGNRAVVWLSPTGTDHTVIERWAPAVADALKAPFIAIDPPRSMGPHAGAWTGDLLRDRAWVEDALGVALADRKAASGLMLIGAGRSGRVALDLALRSPSSISAVLALSPDAAATDKLDPAVLAIYERNQKALVVAGLGDSARDADLRSERARMVRAGVDARLDIDSVPWVDQLPPRLPSRVANWINEFRPGMETPRLPAPPTATSALQTAPVVPVVEAPAMDGAAPGAEDPALGTSEGGDAAPDGSTAAAPTGPDDAAAPAGEGEPQPGGSENPTDDGTQGLASPPESTGDVSPIRASREP